MVIKDIKQITMLLFVLIYFCMLPNDVCAYDSESDLTFHNQLVDEANQNNLSEVANLLNQGYSVNSTGDFAVTPLMRAAYNGNDDMVKLLITAGANINLADLGGATALHIAARRNHLLVVQSLVNAGAKVNIQDQNGWTPIMRATLSKNPQMVGFLMRHDADPFIENKWHQNAIELAAKVGSAPVVQTYINDLSNSSKKLNTLQAKKIETISQNWGEDKFIDLVKTMVNKVVSNQPMISNTAAQLEVNEQKNQFSSAEDVKKQFEIPKQNHTNIEKAIAIGPPINQKNINPINEIPHQLPTDSSTMLSQHVHLPTQSKDNPTIIPDHMNGVITPDLLPNRKIESSHLQQSIPNNNVGSMDHTSTIDNNTTTAPNTNKNPEVPIIHAITTTKNKPKNTPPVPGIDLPSVNNTTNNNQISSVQESSSTQTEPINNTALHPPASNVSSNPAVVVPHPPIIQESTMPTASDIPVKVNDTTDTVKTAPASMPNQNNQMMTVNSTNYWQTQYAKYSSKNSVYDYAYNTPENNYTEIPKILYALIASQNNEKNIAKKEENKNEQKQKKPKDNTITNNQPAPNGALAKKEITTQPAKEEAQDDNTISNQDNKNTLKVAKAIRIPIKENPKSVEIVWPDNSNTSNDINSSTQKAETTRNYKYWEELPMMLQKPVWLFTKFAAYKEDAENFENTLKQYHAIKGMKVTMSLQQRNDGKSIAIVKVGPIRSQARARTLCQIIKQLRGSSPDDISKDNKWCGFTEEE